ncbi:MAG: LTA synthase family protein [Bacilli bacterium]|nr:LTA synthase family protein [Bacilli bacterium]
MIKKIMGLIKKYSYIIFMFLSMYSIDIYLRYYNLGTGFGGLLSKTANLFSFAWILFFIFIVFLFKGKFKKTVFIIFVLIAQALLITNYLYCEMFNGFFTFNSITYAGQAADYAASLFNYIKLPCGLTLLISAAFCVIALIKMPKEKEKHNKIILISLLGLSIGCYVLARVFLGPLADNSAFSQWNTKRNVYNSFTDTRKCLQTTGIYEYTLRDIYFATIKKWTVDDSKYTSYLDNYFDEKEVNTEPNLFTNKYKDKNVIIVMMETIDTFLTDKETMPTVNKMMKEGINFTNHYAPVYVSGATFNSEFMVNTGYTTPLNGESAANKYGRNIFPFSLANLFSNEGYEANVFHENYGSFYNRRQMTKVFGYANYYGSRDLGISATDAAKDTHFLTNKKINKYFLSGEKYLDFVITYSAHMPYTLDNSECSENATDAEKKEIKNGGNEELICLRAGARATDDFFALLLDKLEKNDELDNTVIIAFADHYAYTLSDKETLYDLKGTDDTNLVNKVPFFIWSTDTESQEVKTINSNLDFLPTIVNLFGLEVDSKYYLGQDIFSDTYNDFVFFSDYSWHDGDVYYKNGEVEIGKNVSKKYITLQNKKLEELLKLNKYVLDTNYFNGKQFK